MIESNQDPGAPDGLALLAGCGEMGERTRAFDWSQTPVGPVQLWPQSLKTVVRTMLSSRYAMWLGWGPEFTFFYNDAYARMTLGPKHPWALGKSAREVWSEIWPEVGPRAESVMRSGLATWDEGLQLTLERRGFREETYHTFSYSPVPDDYGNVGGMLCVVIEDTERTIGERRLRTLREVAARTTDVARSVEIACQTAAQTLSANRYDVPFVLLYLLNSDGRNTSLVGCAGLEPGSLAAPVELPLDDSLWPFEQVIQSREAVVVDLLISRCGPLTSGVWPERTERAVVLPLARPGLSSPAGFMVAGISPRLEFNDDYRGFFELLAGHIATAVANARAYDEERQRSEALLQLDRAKTAFFSNVSHEFRTPLTLMLGPINDLMSDPSKLVDTADRQQLQLVQRNGRRLQKLVNTLLDFSRIEAGKHKASFEPTDLGSLTADLASNFRSACQKAGLGLTVDCPRLSEPVYVDRSMWEKIVLNLLSNAFKFTFEGGIQISLHKVGNSVVLRVRDTGTGIPAIEIPRLFERFHRIENSRGRTHEGSGIGLALVQELVKLHGGSIIAESEVDKGTTLTLTLPVGHAHLPRDQVVDRPVEYETARGANVYVEEAMRWLAGSDSPADEMPRLEDVEDDPLPPQPPSTSGSVASDRARVIVADDNADMRQYIERLLSPYYDVEGVSHGEAALQSIRRRTPDLVLTDVMMPRLDGFGLLREIRSERQTAGIPVIMLSARAGEESRVEGIQAGADDYLVKPFSARELLARVQVLIQIHRLRRDSETAIRKSGDRVRLLWEAAAVLLTTDEPNAMLSQLFSRISPQLKLDAYFNFMVNDARTGLRLASCEGIPERVIPQIRDLAFGQAICGTVAVQRSPLVATFIQESDDPKVQLVKSLGIRSYACNPLIAGDQLLGTLSFGSRSRDEFDADEIDLMQTVCRYVTAAYERLRLISQLKEADRRKDEFLATLAHELRNPLAPLRNGLQVLKLGRSNGDAVEQSHAIMERQLAQMVRLIDDLMDMSRISRGKVELRKERVELTRILNQAVETSQPLIEESGHRLTVSIPDSPIFVDADVTRMTQVISNLLNNAAKYTDCGGQISLEAECRGDEVEIRVRDNGVGIPSSMLPQVFDMFTQVDRSLEKSKGGLGIGLSLVKGLVEKHQGTVEARSDGQGRGSVFVVRLPVVMARDCSKGHASSLALGPSSQRRVLVVDDNHDAALSLATMLRMMGNDTRTAHDGLEALDVADTFQPELVLLDIGMPRLNGFDTAQRIRERSWGKDTMLIALTGWGQDEDRRKSQEAGFDSHLTKPVDPAVLENLLAQCRGTSVPQDLIVEN